MKLQELMTTEVITVAPGTTLKEAARRMIEARISGLPVTAETGELIGMISEADFVKEEAGRRPAKRTRLLGWIHTDEPLDTERLVGAVMTSPVLTLPVEADHAAAARLMKDKNVKRVPVVDTNGDLAGLVSRSDILRAFARPDSEIVEEIKGRIIPHTLWIDPKLVEVISTDGNVTLSGRLETKSEAHVIVEFVKRVDGVVSVKNHLSWEIDNTRLKMVSPPRPGPNW